VERLVDAQNRAGIVKLVAIVWRRKDRHEPAIGKEFVAVRDDLVRAAHEIQVVGLQKLLYDVGAENVRYAAVAFGPALAVWVRIGPQQITQQALPL
jgi:hypothetical protein